ncbi:MAG TPA: tetratricopeptide repeat protein, partial [Gammaproteobacteria bacterium]|nr:tetratricopeptide repeat protein [Gammaproteobacteria bacterium]
SIQQELARRNRELADERKVQFRIGVNLGEVIVDRDDLYGDGVNVAARLEGLADPGGVCISDSVRSAIGKKLPLDYEFLGEQQVKNIAEPVKAYKARLMPGAVLPAPGLSLEARRRGHRRSVVSGVIALLLIVAGVIAWLAPWTSEREDAALPLPEKPSIAVLPFDNLSGDPQQEYFSDGISNDIITDLSKFRDLLVIASNTVFTYKGKAVNVQDVSRELGVRYVLEGSVQRADGKVRVNAQLIDAMTGHHLWAERYDRELKDLFVLQDEIVETIVRTLAVKVRTVERERTMRKGTGSLEAYDYVLRGRERLSRTTRATNLEAREMFQRAVELDRRYASAYVGLGWTYRKAAGHGWTEFPNQALERAHELAQKALELEESSDAYGLLGYIYLFRKQYDLASHALERALELNPNDWESLSVLASTMLYTGRTEVAVQTFETTLRFNPAMDSDKLMELGIAYYLRSRYDDAIRTLQQGLGRNPDHPYLHAVLAAAHAQAGHREDAARAAAAVRRLHPFLETDSFGDRFLNPEDQAHLIDGLRKAGLT